MCLVLDRAYYTNTGHVTDLRLQITPMQAIWLVLDQVNYTNASHLTDLRTCKLHQWKPLGWYKTAPMQVDWKNVKTADLTFFFMNELSQIMGLLRKQYTYMYKLITLTYFILELRS